MKADSPKDFSEGYGSIAGAAPRSWPSRLSAYLASIGLVAVASGLAHFTEGLASSAGLTLIFLAAVVISANRFGLWPAVFTSVLGILSWDYFFTLPYYSLELDDPRDAFALVAFLFVSLIVSSMTAQIRRQNERLTVLAKSIATSYELSQTLSQLATIDQLASFAASPPELLTGAQTVLVLIDHGPNRSGLIFPAERTLKPEDLAAADRVLYPLAIPPDPRPSASAYDFLPLDGSRGRIGCLGVATGRLASLAADERRQLEAFLAQAAIAIERARLTRDIEHARMTAETERVRNAMLTSVSHDLRTPLTTIIGALSTLKSMGTAFSPAIHAELISTARGEAGRLNRFIGNLLDITRLESGALNVPISPIDVGEVVESAVERARELLERHKLEIDMPSDTPEVRANHGLLEQVFFNLLDNAAKYSPPGSKITIRAAASPAHVVVTVSDEGRGIPEAVLEKIFEKFARFDQGDAVSPGTGLGLMICRGFLSAMGGSIRAANRADRRGATFSIELERAPAP